MIHMGFLLFPLTMPFSCICCVFNSFFLCCGRLRIVNVISMFDGIIGVLLFSFMLVPSLKMTGIWLAHIFSGVLCVLILLGYICILNRKFPKCIADLLLLSDSFGVSEDNRIELSVGTNEEVVQLSERVVEFCTEKGSDSRKSMYTGLAVEEMAGNVVTHGFNDKKKHRIYIRAILKTEKLIVSIKDDCKGFNPKEYAEIFVPEDITHNIGIRMISRIADDLAYQNSFGLNALTISIAR